MSGQSSSPSVPTNGGYRKIFDLLTGEDVQIRERVRLIRRREGLQVPTKFRKKVDLPRSGGRFV